AGSDSSERIVLDCGRDSGGPSRLARLYAAPPAVRDRAELAEDRCLSAARCGSRRADTVAPAGTHDRPLGDPHPPAPDLRNRGSSGERGVEVRPRAVADLAGHPADRSGTGSDRGDFLAGFSGPWT